MKTVKILKLFSIVNIFLAVLLLFGSGHSRSEELSFVPVADTSVRSDKPDTNYGAKAVFEVDGSPKMITYLRFNITGLNGSVESARLKLDNINKSSFGGAIYSLSDKSWDEYTLTYNNRPDIDGSFLDSLGPVKVGDIVELDITEAINGNGIHSFAIISDNYNRVGYCSREDLTNPPKLIITTAIHVPGDQPTIQAGIDAARDGDIILISPGIYYENLKLDGKRVTLASWFYTTGKQEYIEQTIIDGGGDTVIEVGDGSEDTKIVGLTIQNGNDGIRVYSKIHILNNHIISNVDGVDYEGGGGTCSNNLVANNRDDGIDLDGPTAATITNNTIQDNGDDGIGIRLHEYSGSVLNIDIRENQISGNQEDGIQLIDYSDVSDRIFRIERNLFLNNAKAAIGFKVKGNTEEDCSGADIPERVYLINNTFIGGSYGVVGGANLIGLNNIFKDIENTALRRVNVDSIASYSLFWNNGTDYEESNIDLANILFADPLLDVDYSLTVNSPAINAGTASFEWQGEEVLEIPETAYMGPAPDLGAYESAYGVRIHVPGDQPTIQSAINAARDGDIILISPGIYYENLKLDGKRVTLTSWFYTTGKQEYIEQTIIDGGGDTVIEVGDVSEDTKIVGLTIQNGNDGISAISKIHILNNHIISNVDGVDYEGGGGTCSNNLFANNRDDGIDLDGPTEATITNNTIQDNGDDGIEIRLHKYSGPVLNIDIRENQISGNQEDGIQLIDYSDVSDRIFRIERNLFLNNAKAAIGFTVRGNTEEDYSGAAIPERVYLINNTFVGGSYGVVGGANLIGLNNIFKDIENTALRRVNVDSIASYSLFWNNGTDYEESNIDLANILFADPLLDVDYSLTVTSPAINAGTASFEWQGEEVLQIPETAYTCPAPDLGAYEYAQGPPLSYLRGIRAMDDFDLVNPAGLAFSFDVNVYFVLEAHSTTQANIATMTPLEEVVAWVSVDVSLMDPINLAFDNLFKRLLLFDSGSNELVEIKTGPDGYLDPSPDAITRFQVGNLGLQEPRGMTIDPANGHLFILDSAALQIVRIEPDAEGGFDGTAALNEGRISWVDLTQTDLVDPRGLAFNPSNGHLYLLSPVDQRIYELIETGCVVMILELPPFEFNDPYGMVFALSGDNTDDPSIINLVIADTGLSAAARGRILELSPQSGGWKLP